MSILGGTTNFRLTAAPTRRRLFWMWDGATRRPWAYVPETQKTYEWPTDKDGYAGTLLDPDNLQASGWGCEYYGPVVGYGDEQGRYQETYIQRGGFTIL